MDKKQEMFKLFIDKNFTLDLTKRVIIKTSDVYSIYKLWSTKLNYTISRILFFKFIKNFNLEIKILHGYRYLRLIPKINPEELIEEEIIKFKKLTKDEQEIKKQFDLYKEKPLIKKIKKQKKEIIPYVESDDPCDIYEYHHKNPKK